jgi:3-oxoacyl-[acyl-carrier protein] reductase
MLAGSPHDRSGVGRQGGTGDRSQPRHRAATARGRGPRRDVLLTYLRLHLAAQAGETAYPAEYDHLRAGTAEHLVEQIRGAGGTAACMEADLADPAVPRLLFADAEAALGPIEILINNASSWLANTFLPEEHDRFGRILGPVDAERHDR